MEQTTRALRQTRDELRTLARGLIVTQEEERRRVARELHDDLAQKLALIEIMADAVLKDQENSESMRRELAGLREKIQALSADIRRISHQLHPSVLEDLGLPLALEQLVEEFGRSENMPAEFFTQNVSSRPSSSAATTFYRIAQEALRNVAKYAGRTHVKVTLAETSDQLRLTIRDFGQGFDVEETKQRSGLGLLSMSERARLMQGTFHVSSGLGEGTSVEVAVPKSALSE